MKKFLTLILLCSMTFLLCSCYTEDEMEQIRQYANHEGYADGQSSTKQNIGMENNKESYNNGYSEGYNEGYDFAYDNGYIDGYRDGLHDSSDH